MRVPFLYPLLAILFFQTLISKPPRWYGKPLNKYPISDFFVGEGTGFDCSEALLYAQEVIVSQIRVTIKSELNIYTSEVSHGDKAEVEEIFEFAINSVVDETVNGISAVKKKKRKNECYVSAALNKEKFLAGIKVELDELWTKITKLTSDADRMIDEGNIYTALGNYADAEPFISPFYVKKSLYDSISDRPYSINEFITVEGIISKIRTLINEIRIRVVSGEEQIGVPGSSLKETIVIEAVYSKDNTTIPDVVLVLRHDDGSKEKVKTDESGIVQLSPVVSCENNRSAKLRISLDLLKLPRLYKKYFMNISTNTSYNCENDNVFSFSVKVLDGEGGTLPKVQNRISSSIESLGHSISDNPEIYLEADVSVLSEIEIQGRSGTMVQAKTELSVTLFALPSMDRLGSFSYTFSGVGKSPYAAKRKAYSKMKIKRKAFESLLSDIKVNLNNGN